jgi:hypothetical protein
MHRQLFRSLGRQTLPELFPSYLFFRLMMRSSRWAEDICPIRFLRSLPSSTHLATSSRSSDGTCRVRVRPPSFQVSNAVSWIGPSRAQRQLGFPHRFMQIDSDACTKGLILRMRDRMRFPDSLVNAGRAMMECIHTYHILSTQISCWRMQSHSVAWLFRNNLYRTKQQLPHGAEGCQPSRVTVRLSACVCGGNVDFLAG